MKSLHLASALLLLSLAPAAPLDAGERVLIDQAAIIVDNKMMTRLELDTVLDLRGKEYESTFKGSELEEKMAGLDEEIVEQAISNLLLEARAEELNIQVGDKEIDERVRALHQRDPRISEAYTDTTLRELVVKDLLSKRVLQREVNGRIIVKDEEVRQACLDATGDNREIDVGHVLLKADAPDVEEKLKKIRNLLEQGSSFEEVALEYSVDPSAKRNKGRLGFVSKGQFVKPFEETAFSLPVGKLSEPVRTKFGLHLIKVFEERRKEETDCEEMNDLTRRRFYDRTWNDKRQERMERFFGDLKKNADIRVLYRPSS